MPSSLATTDPYGAIKDSFYADTLRFVTRSGSAATQWQVVFNAETATRQLYEMRLNLPRSLAGGLSLTPVESATSTQLVHSNALQQRQASPPIYQQHSEPNGPWARAAEITAFAVIPLPFAAFCGLSTSLDGTLNVVCALVVPLSRLQPQDALPAGENLTRRLLIRDVWKPRLNSTSVLYLDDHSRHATYVHLHNSNRVSLSNRKIHVAGSQQPHHQPYAAVRTV